jgi:hypothetical protein
MLFVVNSLGFKPGVLGVIFAVGGASSLFGALAARRTADALGTGMAIAAGVAINGVALMLLPIAATIYYINAVSLIQAITPRPMLGRVNASLRFLGLASVLLGQLVAGVAGGVIGLRATIAIGAAGLWVTAAILAVSVVGSVGEISGTPEIQVEAGN